MKQLVKANNNEIVFRLKQLNYNNVYARLRSVLGKEAELFADIQYKVKETIWFVADEKTYTSLANAPADVVGIVQNTLAEKLVVVKRKLSNHKDLVPYIDDLLEVPETKFIYFTLAEDGNFRVVLTAWGCRTAHTTIVPGNGVLGGLVREKTPKVQRVSVQVVDWQGERVYDGLFQFDCGEINQTVSLDSNGVVKLGNFPIGDTFDISDVATRQKMTFTVQQGCSIYEFKKDRPAPEIAPRTVEPAGGGNVVPSIEPPKTPVTKGPVNILPEKKPEISEIDVPLTVKAQHIYVRLVDQNQEVVCDEIVEIEYDTNLKTAMTDSRGMADFGELQCGKVFMASLPENASVKPKTFEVVNGKSCYDMPMRRIVQYAPTVFVEDEDGNIALNHELKVMIAGKEQSYNTGNNGVIQLPSMSEGEKFVVTDGANQANVKEFVIRPEQSDKPYHFLVNSVKGQKVYIKLVDKNENPISKAVIALKNGPTSHSTTNQLGIAEFPVDLFKPGKMPLDISVPGERIKKSCLKYNPEFNSYTMRIIPHPSFFSFMDWKWLVISLLALVLAGGGYWAWERYFSKPTLEELKKGIVLIKTDCYYYVDTGLSLYGKPFQLYFSYDLNSKEFSNFTLGDDGKIPDSGGTGTGFFISKDGEIATNRHVASPIPPQASVFQFKKIIDDWRTKEKEKVSKIQDQLNQLGVLKNLSDEAEYEYNKLLEQKQKLDELIMVYDRVLQLGTFEPKVKTKVGVAFYNSRIDEWDDFVECIVKCYGEPGEIASNDLAIIQLKDTRSMPDDAYIYKIPEKEPLPEKEIGDYNVFVLGYNGTISLANIEEGISPQKTPGVISGVTDKFRVMYTCCTLGGSSGSPVLNDDCELVAINNSGRGDTQGFNFGVRTKYLKELYDKLHK